LVGSRVRIHLLRPRVLCLLLRLQHLQQTGAGICSVRDNELEQSMNEMLARAHLGYIDAEYELLVTLRWRCSGAVYKAYIHSNV
jgi:hypothetical protein